MVLIFVMNNNYTLTCDDNTISSYTVAMFRRGVLGLLVFWITSVYAQSAVPCRCTNEAFDSLCSTTATGTERAL